MTSKQIYDVIEKAINTQTELLLTVKHGLGENIDNTSFQPYILGDDTYQYSFVWGYLTHSGLYYKFMLDNISFAKLTTKKYGVREDACYQHSIEEEHFSRIENFDNIYAQAAQFNKNQVDPK